LLNSKTKVLFDDGQRRRSRDCLQKSELIRFVMNWKWESPGSPTGRLI